MTVLYLYAVLPNTPFVIIRSLKEGWTMQASPFTGAHNKLVRARRHLEELRAAISAFFATQPYEVVQLEETSTGDLTYTLRIHHEVKVWNSFESRKQRGRVKSRLSL